MKKQRILKVKETSQEKVIRLANQLLKECFKCGCVMGDDGFLYLNVFVFHQEKLQVGDLLQNFEIEGKYEGGKTIAN